jgi:hypothetical protein
MQFDQTTAISRDMSAALVRAGGQSERPAALTPRGVEQARE